MNHINFTRVMAYLLWFRNYWLDSLELNSLPLYFINIHHDSAYKKMKKAVPSRTLQNPLEGRGWGVEYTAIAKLMNYINKRPITESELN